MKIKPKEVLLNLPVALLFDESWEISSFAANINTILHGKVRLKAEELGTLGGRHVGLFYLQRNNESQEIHDEFVRLIEEEEMAQLPLFESKEQATKREELRHVECFDCDALIMLHQKGQTHCECGEDWDNGCDSKKIKK